MRLARSPGRSRPRSPGAETITRANALPSGPELAAAGARVGKVTVLNRDNFDLSKPKEDQALFRLANRLHIQTRPGFIERRCRSPAAIPCR